MNIQSELKTYEYFLEKFETPENIIKKGGPGATLFWILKKDPEVYEKLKHSAQRNNLSIHISRKDSTKIHIGNDTDIEGAYWKIAEIDRPACIDSDDALQLMGQFLLEGIQNAA